MIIHKLYLADEYGGFSGYDRLKVFVDAGILHIGKQLNLPITNIIECQLVRIRVGKFALVKTKREYIRIVACDPAVNRGEPFEVFLIRQDFLYRTTRRKMQAFVDELAPLIKDNTLERIRQNFAPECIEEVVPDGKLKLGYALNVSLFIGGYRKTWFSFDTPKKALFKTFGLMLLGSLGNLVGVFLVAVPFDNWMMSKNLLALGYKQAHQWMVYLGSLLIPVLFWIWVLTRWGGAK